MKHLFSLMVLLSIVACSSSESGQPKAPSKSIHEAAFFGDAEAIKQHIAFGTDLNQKDEYGSTPLSIAITFNKPAVAHALINGGADLSATTADGSTALHSAVFYGRTEIVKELLKKNVNLEAVNNFGSTPLAIVTTPFEQVKPIYDQISKDLGPLGFRLDYDELQLARIEISQLLSK
jgi:ankyrin repeat protein